MKSKYLFFVRVSVPKLRENPRLLNHFVGLLPKFRDAQSDNGHQIDKPDRFQKTVGFNNYENVQLS
ncbi:hypothetical protein DBR27_16210 [Flavobacterium sp. HMWF030]|nr:hypothetical protein DBR27_16210 [Flavobacterium sp. HMWF030]